MKLSARCGYCLTSCWSERPQRPPNHTGYCHCCWLLSTQHTLVVRRGEVKLKVTWNLPTCWLVFTGPEGAVQASRGGTSSVDFLSGRPACYNTAPPDKVCRPVQLWNDYHGDKQLLYDLIWDLLCTRELVPGTVHLVKSLWQVTGPRGGLLLLC